MVGSRAQVSVEPAVPTSINKFQQFQRHGDQYVVPVEAAKLVQDGVLDLELFNVPLLTVRFDPTVNLRNEAPAGPFSFPAYLSRQDGGVVKATSFTVEVSYDDGETWGPATVNPDGDHYQVTVQNPGTGYAALRAEASDPDGNTVEQTVLRGYAIGR